MKINVKADIFKRELYANEWKKSEKLNKSEMPAARSIHKQMSKEDTHIPISQFKQQFWENRWHLIALGMQMPYES